MGSGSMLKPATQRVGEVTRGPAVCVADAVGAQAGRAATVTAGRGEPALVRGGDQTAGSKQTTTATPAGAALRLRASLELGGVA